MSIRLYYHEWMKAWIVEWAIWRFHGKIQLFDSGRWGNVNE